MAVFSVENGVHPHHVVIDSWLPFMFVGFRRHPPQAAIRMHQFADFRGKRPVLMLLPD